MRRRARVPWARRLGRPAEPSQGIPAPLRVRLLQPEAPRHPLWGKTGRNGAPTPWVTYPDRMLQMRARGFALRDVFADALRGVITAEEAQDIPTEPRFVPAAEAEPLPAGPCDAVGPTALVSLGELKLDALEDQLAGLATVEGLRGYLDQAAVEGWLARLRRNQPDRAAQADSCFSSGR